MIQMALSMQEAQAYLAFIIVLGGAMTSVFAFTPKGYRVAMKVYNFLERNFWHKDLYARLSTLDGRIDAVEVNIDQVEIELKQMLPKPTMEDIG